MDRINKPVSFLLLLFLLMNCQEEEPIVDKVEQPAAARYTIAGYVQKGPFINGTTLTIAELDDSLRATGKNFSAQINDNKGSFSLEDIELASSNVQLTANGFYFDEVKGEKSIAQLTLTALTNIDGKDQTNVNLLSHLIKDRILYLIRQGNMFTEAKQQAQQEVLSIFGIIKEDLVSAELLDISKEGEDNAILLAISAILQANNTVAELSELLANIITDIREDGKLNDQAVQKQLVKQSTLLRLPQIRTHLEKRYEELKVNASIANFEKYVDSDGDNILNKDEDDTPDEFVFSMQKDVAINTEITSDQITISGLKAEGYAEASVQKAKLMLNDVILTDTLAKVKNGDKIKLLLTSSSQYADTVVANMTVGYLTSYFTVVTDDYKPDSFSFTAQKDVAVDSFYTSNTITVSGLPYLTPATIEKGVLIKNGVILKSDTALIKNGDKLAIRLRSSNQYATAASSTLDINGITAAFEVITDDYKPDAFSFIEQKDVAVDSLYVSNTITLSGLLYPTPASVENGILIKNGVELRENTTTVKNGDQLAIKLLSSSLYLTTATATLTINKTAAAFKIITDDYKPDDFSFTPVVNARRNIFYFSDTITISGLQYPAPISSNLTFYYSETETETLFINGEEVKNPDAVVKNGDRISIKAQTGYDFLTPYLSFITIGNTNYEFRITTMPEPIRYPNPQPGDDVLAGFAIDEKLYLFIYNGGFYEFDFKTNKRVKKADIPAAVGSGASGFSLNGKGYLGNWEYNPSTDTWKSIASFPGTPREKAVTFTIGNKAYVGLGKSGNTYLKDIWQYDPITDTWTQKSNFPGAGRINAFAFSFSDKSFVGSGSIEIAPYNYQHFYDLWEYNPVGDNWTQKNDVEGAPLLASFTLNGKGYVIHYGDGGISEYDPKYDRWTIIESYLFDPLGTMQQGFSMKERGYFIIQYNMLVEFMPLQE